MDPAAHFAVVAVGLTAIAAGFALLLRPSAPLLPAPQLDPAPEDEPETNEEEEADRGSEDGLLRHGLLSERQRQHPGEGLPDGVGVRVGVGDGGLGPEGIDPPLAEERTAGAAPAPKSRIRAWLGWGLAATVLIWKFGA